ncbi:hypothetical protein BDR07DRAFT_1456997 [Suillus spraguei]|nr:hypothetical protein BDR07DRAFT_1456997 [Suillus spraguei]
MSLSTWQWYIGLHVMMILNATGATYYSIVGIRGNSLTETRQSPSFGGRMRRAPYVHRLRPTLSSEDKEVPCPSRLQYNAGSYALYVYVLLLLISLLVIICHVETDIDKLGAMRD